MKKVHPIFYWGVPLLLLLAACSEDAVPIANSSDVANVRVASNLGADTAGTAEALSVQGVPVNRETGEPGVAKAVLEVYNTSADEQLFFKDGQIVSEAEGEAVTFTPEEGGVALALPPGTYSFFLRAFDDREPANELAFGLSENVEVGDADVQVSITLSSFLGEVSFRVPESAQPNAVFDAFLEVSAPGRPDLRVPEGDYLVGYAVSPPSQVLSESKLGARVAAACEDVEITARYRSNGPRSAGGLRETSATVPVRGEACGDGSGVGADLVPPFVAITSLEDGSTVGQTFTLSGDVNDQQSGVEKVEIYEGTRKLGEAEVNGEEMTWTFGVSLDKGDYTLIAVAFDNAGNTSREEVRVTVGEGEGDEDETCTSPVDIPDENLRRTIEGALGLPDDAELTCEALAELTELTLFTSVPRRGPDTRVMRLEGLQFARNLERLVIGEDFRSSTPVEDLGVISSLKKLTYFETDLRLEDLSFLAGATALEEIILNAWRGGAAIRFSTLDPLTDLTNLRVLDLTSAGRFEDCPEGLGNIADISALANLTKLENLNLSLNSVDDITPLVENEGLGEGDVVNLFGNPLEADPGGEDRQDIDALIERGVEVEFDTSEDCADGGDGNDNQVVEVPDAALERLIREEIDKPEGELTRADLLKVEEVVLDRNASPSEDTIRSLEGLQFATNLSVLDLENNYIQNLTPLVDNEGLGEGDEIILTRNPLGTCRGAEDQDDISALRARGVNVEVSEANNCGPPEPGLRGGTINVTSTSDEAYFTDGCTLRDAITAANTGVAIGGCPSASSIEVIELGGEVYTLTEVDNITDGANGLPSVEGGIFLRDGTIERAEGAPEFRILHIPEGGGVTAVVVTFQNGIATPDSAGRSRGGGIYNAGDLRIDSGSIVQNNTAAEGGGIYNEGNVISVNEVRENSAEGDGGGVYNVGKFSLGGGLLSGNRSGGNGGGFYNAAYEVEEFSVIGAGVVENNTAANLAGAIYNEAGELVVGEMQIRGNSSQGNEPVIVNESELTLDQVMYEANAAGVANFDGTLTITDSTFRENPYALENDSTALVTNSTFEETSVRAEDVAVIRNAGTLTLTQSALESNRALDEFSDGVFALSNTGEATVTESSFSGNAQMTPIRNTASGTLSLQGSRVSGNDSDGVFVGVINDGQATIVDSAITDNENEQGSAGVSNSGVMEIERSLVSGNDGLFGGRGGLFNSGTLTLLNATVSGNSASFGPNVSNSGTMDIRYSTIKGNRPDRQDAEGDAPTALRNEGTLTLHASILENSDGSSLVNCGGSGTFTSEGYNLVSDDSCALDQEGDLAGVDPQLGPLEDNGGPTLTHALQEGSPAIDAIPTDACEVDADQRGVSRPQGEACDSGAFERE